MQAPAESCFSFFKIEGREGSEIFGQIFFAQEVLYGAMLIRVVDVQPEGLGLDAIAFSEPVIIRRSQDQKGFALLAENSKEFSNCVPHLCGFSVVEHPKAQHQIKRTITKGKRKHRAFNHYRAHAGSHACFACMSQTSKRNIKAVGFETQFGNEFQVATTTCPEIKDARLGSVRLLSLSVRHQEPDYMLVGIDRPKPGLFVKNVPVCCRIFGNLIIHQPCFPQRPTRDNYREGSHRKTSALVLAVDGGGASSDSWTALVKL